MTQQENDLMTALDFTADDLEANRNGRLSQSQSSRLKIDQLGLIVIPVCVGGFAVMTASFLPQSNGLPNVISLVLCGATAVSAVYVLYRFPRLTSDLIAGDVFKVDGKPEFSPDSRRDLHVMHVQKLRFVISESALKALKPNCRYRIYYTPRSKILLSAEWIGEDS